jgi:hypothetical protein
LSIDKVTVAPGFVHFGCPLTVIFSPRWYSPLSAFGLMHGFGFGGLVFFGVCDGLAEAEAEAEVVGGGGFEGDVDPEAVGEVEGEVDGEVEGAVEGDVDGEVEGVGGG